MGIINEIKHVYESLNKLNRYELNSIIAERISAYSYTVLNEEEIRAIKNEFGSVEYFSNVLAESFTRNNGSFDDFTINEGTISEGGWGSVVKVAKGGWNLLRRGGKHVVRKITGKPVGKVVERFTVHELDDIAKYAGKAAKDVSHADIAKYVTRRLTKNANRNVVKQLEKQAKWLSKNTNMNAKQMEEFMAKYAKCPPDCDPKIWKKAFKEEAKAFTGGTKLEKGLVRARYNALARGTGKVGGSVVRSAGKTSLTRRMFKGLAKIAGKVVWKIVKVGGILYLIYKGLKYVWDHRAEIWQAINGGGAGGGSGSGSSAEMDSIYPKIYGKDYLNEDPEDYRII